MGEYLLESKKLIEINIESSNINRDIDNIIYKINDKSNFYLNLKKIKIELNKAILEIIEKNSHELKNRCISCGIDMGIDNPRQLCGKTKCIYYEF